MKNTGLALTVLAVAALAGSDPARAQAPWCAVQSIGHGSMVERCIFFDFESCRREVIAGNRGYCNQNPRWAGRPTYPAKPRYSRKRTRH